MKIYLDTSSLIKLYFVEQGTEELDEFLNANQIDQIYLSEIAKVEFSGAIWKKVRTHELKEEDALILIDGFTSDYEKYLFMAITPEIITQAIRLIAKYGLRGLRTLDAIHLASVVAIKDQIETSFSADKLLKGFIEDEGVNIK